MVKLRAEIVFFIAVDWIEGARYSHRRRATHIRGATHIASPALCKEHGCYAYGARYALGRRATHTVTEPKKIVFASDFELKHLHQLASRFLIIAQ